MEPRRSFIGKRCRRGSKNSPEDCFCVGEPPQEFLPIPRQSGIHALSLACCLCAIERKAVEHAVLSRRRHDLTTDCFLVTTIDRQHLFCAGAQIHNVHPARLPVADTQSAKGYLDCAMSATIATYHSLVTFSRFLLFISNAFCRHRHGIFGIA